MGEGSSPFRTARNQSQGTTPKCSTILSLMHSMEYNLPPYWLIAADRIQQTPRSPLSTWGFRQKKKKNSIFIMKKTIFLLKAICSKELPALRCWTNHPSSGYKIRRTLKVHPCPHLLGSSSLHNRSSISPHWTFLL